MACPKLWSQLQATAVGGGVGSCAPPVGIVDGGRGSMATGAGSGIRASKRRLSNRRLIASQAFFMNRNRKKLNRRF